MSANKFGDGADPTRRERHAVPDAAPEHDRSAEGGWAAEERGADSSGVGAPDAAQTSEREIEADALRFMSRCREFAPETQRPFIPATKRLAWASHDTTTWGFNPREVTELRALIENLLDKVGA